MKILMTVMMMAAMTSTFAGECKLDGECKDDADCKALNKDYSVVDGKCFRQDASEKKESDCAGIVNSSLPKGTAGASAGGEDAGKNKSK